jgi:hypothetical protein
LTTPVIATTTINSTPDTATHCTPTPGFASSAAFSSLPSMPVCDPSMMMAGLANYLSSFMSMPNACTFSSKPDMARRVGGYGQLATGSGTQEGDPTQGSVLSDGTTPHGRPNSVSARTFAVPVSSVQPGSGDASVSGYVPRLAASSLVERDSSVPLPIESSRYGPMAGMPATHSYLELDTPADVDYTLAHSGQLSFSGHYSAGSGQDPEYDSEDRFRPRPNLGGQGPAVSGQRAAVRGRLPAKKTNKAETNGAKPAGKAQRSQLSGQVPAGKAQRAQRSGQSPAGTAQRAQLSGQSPAGTAKRAGSGGLNTKYMVSHSAHAKARERRARVESRSSSFDRSSSESSSPRRSSAKVQRLTSQQRPVSTQNASIPVQQSQASVQRASDVFQRASAVFQRSSASNQRAKPSQKASASTQRSGAPNSPPASDLESVWDRSSADQQSPADNRSRSRSPVHHRPRHRRRQVTRSSPRRSQRSSGGYAADSDTTRGVTPRRSSSGQPRRSRVEPRQSRRHSSVEEVSASEVYTSSIRSHGRRSRDSRSPSSEGSRRRAHKRRHSRSRSPEEGKVSKVSYKRMLKKMEKLLGDDLPSCAVHSKPTLIRSAIRAPKASVDAIRPLPVSSLLSSAVEHAQRSVFGNDSTDIFSKPPLHFIPSNSGKVTAPSFLDAYYQIDGDVLDHRASKIQADAASLWGSKKTDIKDYTFDASTFDKAESAVRKSLLALNHCDWFTSSLVRADEVITDPDSTQRDYDNAVDFNSRVKDSIGMCLETACKQQAFLLSLLLAKKRDSAIHLHKDALHPGLVPFLRAQPILSKQAVFGPVAEIAKELQATSRADKTTAVMKDAVLAMSRSRGGSSRTSSTRGRTSSAFSKSSRSQPRQTSTHTSRPSQYPSRPRTQVSSARPDFTAPPPRGSSSGSRPFRSRGSRRAPRK